MNSVVQSSLIRTATGALLLTGLFSRPANADIILGSDSARWGDTIRVTVTPEFPGDRLYPSDRTFIVLQTSHRALLHLASAEMSWTGQKFTAELTSPEGCELGVLYVRTCEKQNRGTVQVS
jgi:hypothetical protein